MFSNPVVEIRRFIVENFLFGDESAMTGDKESLIDNGILDSTGVLELVAFIEETYDFTMADEEIIPANLDSVVRIAGFVMSKTVRQSA
ncbi:acyl carrier protein [Rhizobium sp. KVB221]|uniref:Acyl carrier protein n=1 Tax=Rhizobium setariae TaxID=2801340 RepID=A0A936YSM6_9HYPH|nr:acyl carrier protein [Rhizobium setariae]MBL0373519.1 acyl carrier protein [Rhizobium setariae]